MPKIGIAITTKNRPESYSVCMDAQKKFQPKDSIIVTVDDGSETCYIQGTGIKSTKSRGISKAKNRCLELLMSFECDHLFLFDDDCFPLVDKWYLPYIQSGQHHLTYTFGKGKVLIEGIKQHVSPNGCMLYFSRHAIETVGGFDTRYNGKFEHTDLSRRIFNSGLIPAPYIDVVGSDEFIYSLDEHNEIKRGMSKAEANKALKEGYQLFKDMERSKEYIEYRLC